MVMTMIIDDWLVIAIVSRFWVILTCFWIMIVVFGMASFIWHYSLCYDHESILGDLPQKPIRLHVLWAFSIHRIATAWNQQKVKQCHYSLPMRWIGTTSLKVTEWVAYRVAHVSGSSHPSFPLLLLEQRLAAWWENWWHVGTGGWTGILSDSSLQWQNCLKYYAKTERIQDTAP